MALASTGSFLKETVSDWSEDKAPQLAAALAFYTMLSIAPLLIITIAVAGLVYGNEAASGRLVEYIRSFVGQQGAEAVQQMVSNAARPTAGIIATVISAVVLLLGASGVFLQLQSSLDTIWEVEPRPDRGWWAMVKERLFSFAMVLSVAFLLMVSLIVSTVVTALAHRFVPSGSGPFMQALPFLIDLAASLVVLTVLFALIFEYVPDAEVRWRDVWFGAAVTAVLFIVGKYLLSWYLSRGSTTSVYGAAGSLVALLLWVYYSAQILFLGAEMTQVWARRSGRAIQPAENAIKVPARRSSFATEPVPGASQAPITAGPVRRIVVDTGELEPSTTRKWAPYVAAGAALLAGSWLGKRSSKPSGWALAGTPSADYLRRKLDAARRDPKLSKAQVAGLDQLENDLEEAAERVEHSRTWGDRWHDLRESLRPMNRRSLTEQFAAGFRKGRREAE